MQYHDLERYPYINSNDFQDYEFYSDGPKGRIEKIVMFTKNPNSEPPIYNLAFGDQDPNSGKTDDVMVNNNEGRDIVLATVANAYISYRISGFPAQHFTQRLIKGILIKRVAFRIAVSHQRGDRTFVMMCLISQIRFYFTIKPVNGLRKPVCTDLQLFIRAVQCPETFPVSFLTFTG